jgi:hypothetical protein
MAWTDTFDSVFWLSVTTGVLGFLGLLVKYAFRSKCDQINFCGPAGLLSIHRRVELENSDEEADVINQQRK